MAATRPEGYDYEFCPPADSKYMCPVCLMVLREPVQTDCGHRFCRACIQRWIRERGGAKCPVCNERVTERSLFSDNCVKREIGALTVRCSNYAKGCTEIGELSNAESHIQQCGFGFVRCGNHCGTFVYRADLKHHMAYECSRRTAKCKLCNSDVLHDQDEAHLLVCPNMRIRCQMCEEEIPRQKIPEHVKKRCPKVMVTCSFEPFSCKAEMPREKMEHHMVESNQQHLMMVAQAVNILFKRSGVPLQFHELGVCTDTQPLLNLADSLTSEAVGITMGTSFGDSNDSRLGLQDLKLTCGTSEIISGLCPNEMAVLDRPGGLSTMTRYSDPATVDPLRLFGSGLQETINSMPGHDVMDRQQKQGIVKQVEYNTAMEARMEKLERVVEEQSARLKYYKQCVESRFCNGTYLWKIKDFFKLRGEATQGRITALHSTGFYCSVYGYKICIRVNLNGVESGFATHVSLFIHFMKGEYDDVLEWPFRGRITLAILDQNEDSASRVDISETLEANPELAAFHKPTTSRNHKGFGYIEFATISQIENGTYVKNDTLFVRVCISSK